MKSFRLDFSQFRGLILPYDEYGRTRATGQHRTLFFIFIEKYARYKFILKLENALLRECVYLCFQISGLNRNSLSDSSSSLSFVYFHYTVEND